MDKIKNFLNENKNKKTLLILAAGLIGIIFILFSEAFPEKEADSVAKEIFVTDISEREKILESRIGEAVSKIKGAGKTYVTITFESSEEKFYAKNFSDSIRENEKEKEEEIVVIDGKNGEEPIYLKTDEPKIRGVLIICEGGANPLIKEKIIEGVCALLDISSNKVSVAEMAK